MKKLFPYFIFTLPLILGAVDVSNLRKVTSDNNPSCVEYYDYQGSIYCSTKALSTEHIDPKIINNETQTIVFDGRPWQAVWGQKEDTHTTIEYVPMGDNINNWHELITSQFFPGLQNKISPEQFAAIQIKNLQDSGFNPIINVIENNQSTYIFEFRILSPANQIQDEIQKITATQNGIYILHYAIKTGDMGEKNRNLWINNFSKSTIKNTD